jgi:hypothetical protein
MRLKIVPFILLCAVGCKTTKITPAIPSAAASPAKLLPIGCGFIGYQYWFALNSTYQQHEYIGYSKVSCDFAQDNWETLYFEGEIEQPEKMRAKYSDPKTGLLP